VTLRISNTLSGEKEHFAPLADPVRIYVCGMTPKNHPHIGHARLFVTADMVRRVLEYRGFHVHQVQNFTDIDDKIIARARLEGITPEQAAKNYTDSYFESMDQLSVRPADAYPTVTGSMPQIIEYIEGLIDRGFAYAVDGDVYFEVARFPAEARGPLACDDGALCRTRPHSVQFDVQQFGMARQRAIDQLLGVDPRVPLWGCSFGRRRRRRRLRRKRQRNGSRYQQECNAFHSRLLDLLVFEHGGS